MPGTNVAGSRAWLRSTPADAPASVALYSAGVSFRLPSHPRFTGGTMRNRRRSARILATTWLVAMSCSAPAQSQAPKAAYPEIAPVEQYRIANRDEEIALARSAAPPSISADAQVLVLGNRGFEIAVKGKNGFVCIVER